LQLKDPVDLLDARLDEQIGALQGVDDPERGQGAEKEGIAWPSMAFA
jgi:hypothetical protein